jgi:uncharacterized protein YcbX
MEGLFDLSILPVFVAVIAVLVGIRLWIKRTPTQTSQDSTVGGIVVTGIYIYPIKSCKGISVQSAKTDDFGFENDRRWMVVSGETNRFVTQRQMPRMALITPTLEKDFLVVNFPGQPTLRIPTSKSKRSNRSILDVGIWSDQVQGVDEGDEAAEWFQRVLDRTDVRLVRMPDDHQRQVPANWLQADMKKNNVSYADGFPFLLAAEESLAELNSRIEGNPLDMRRFRANIIIKGQENAYDEDTWQKIQVGNTVFRVVKKCTRCKLTTVDPDKGEFGTQEPLKTLQTYRKGLLASAPSDVCFAQNLMHESNGEIRVGNRVEIVTSSGQSSA